MAVVDAGEMFPRADGFVEIAQGDPSAHEVEVGAVIFIGGQRRRLDHLVGGQEFALVEQLAGERAPLSPPLVRLLFRHRVR